MRIHRPSGARSVLLAGPVAVVGELVLNLVALALLAVLTWQIRRRGRSAAEAPSRPGTPGCLTNVWQGVVC
jgi:hypothetical protein